MIDIHCHALYGVDDGAKSMEESAAMLRQAGQQGIEAIVLTPHYRHGMFPYPRKKIAANYRALLPEAEALGIGLYLGCEYHVNSRAVEAFGTGRCLTLAGGDFVLAEYSFDTEYAYLCEQTRRLAAYGYIPVIAHVERYGCLLKSPKRCRELADMGAFLQVNADSVLGLAGRTAEKFCRKLLKHRWADIVASDAHGVKERALHLKECRDHVAARYGQDYAELLFEGNPEKVIRSGEEQRGRGKCSLNNRKS